MRRWLAVGVGLLLASAGAAAPREWTWEELARRAGERSDKAKIALLKSAARRQSVAEDLAWKDPQLRLSHAWEDARDRRYAEPPANGDGASAVIGLRVPISNPFVNAQLRRRGSAQVEALEACVRAEAYAVYCEVKSLCLDAEFLGREAAFRREELAIAERLRADFERRLESGVAKSPLDALRAEIAREQALLKLSETEQALRAVRQQITFLAGVREDELRIRYTPPEPPSTNATYAAVLVETAFARRPDLAGALADFEAARSGVGAAKAAHMPWFDFVEGSYTHQTSSGEDWGTERGVMTRRHKSGREDDWQIRVALSVPIFTWLGDSVRQSRLVADAADARVQSLRLAIQGEVESAFAFYRTADARFTRLSDDGCAFLKRMEGRLADYARTPSVQTEDVERARLELVAYRRLKNRAECEWVRGVLQLESVSGGPLPRFTPPSNPPTSRLGDLL
ncbi:MAG: TolC family protein [Kiritimatiellia bacterium]